MNLRNIVDPLMPNPTLRPRFQLPRNRALGINGVGSRKTPVEHRNHDIPTISKLSRNIVNRDGSVELFDASKCRYQNLSPFPQRDRISQFQLFLSRIHLVFQILRRGCSESQKRARSSHPIYSRSRPAPSPGSHRSAHCSRTRWIAVWLTISGFLVLPSARRCWLRAL